ncbi:MAG: hypothetical protein ND866_21685 [Pyrinomonadaceae bacterium]|nr:hypothetical protein [Pyrinomonadaceae bacterium]
MPLERFNRRLSYVFLCATPFLVIIAAAVRSLRIPGVYHVIGGVLFAAIWIAAWTLGARAIRADVQGLRQLGLSGALLVAPFTIVALLWVGIGPPWVATAAENQMRYLVLIVMAIAVAIGFVALREALSEAGERFYSTLGFAAIILASPLYLTWNTFVFGAYFAKGHAGQIPPAFVSLQIGLDILLFLGCALTYVATAAFAASLGRIEWLGRKATLAYAILNFIALFFLVISVLQYPDPAALSAPWYVMPGVFLHVPAVPLIMPFFLGVVLLRRAGR